MPSALSWAAQGLLLAGSVAAGPAKRQGSATLQLDVIKTSGSSASLRKRQTAAEGFSYSQNIYVVPVTLGTPPQTFVSQLDTGSSNLVAFPPALQGNCPFLQSSNLCDIRAFDAGNSTSAKNTGIAWDTSYGDGDAANGYYYLDSLSFNGNSIPDFGFLYASVTNNLTNSVFGTGYAANEDNPNGTYPNLPQRLTSSKYINNPVFSLYLNSDRSTPGSILYGGVDSAKYCGNLATLPIQPNPQVQSRGYDQFNVQLANITATGPNGAATIMSNPGLPALFDTGTSSISLPQAMYNQVLALYNGQAGTGRGYPQVDCSLGTSSYTMSFGFDGVTINVPLSQVVSPPSSGVSTCDFYLNTVAEGSNPPIILGSSFLTSAYTVFDLLDNNLYVAQAIFDAQGSNVMAVSQGTSNVVPLIAGAPCGATTSSSTTAATTTNTNTVTSPAGSMTTTAANTNTNPAVSSSVSGTITYVISPYPTSTPPASTTSSLSHGWPWSCPDGGWWTTATSEQNFWTEWNGVTITESCSYSAITTVTSQLPCTNIIPFTTSTAWSNGQPYPTECPYAVNGHPIAWDESGSAVVPKLSAATGGPWSENGDGSNGGAKGGQWADNGSEGDDGGNGQWADNGAGSNAGSNAGANGGQWADNSNGDNDGGNGQWVDNGSGSNNGGNGQWADNNGASNGGANGGQWADNSNNGDGSSDGTNGGQWADNSNGGNDGGNGQWPDNNGASNGGANGGNGQWTDNNGASNGGANGGQWADNSNNGDGSSDGTNGGQWADNSKGGNKGGNGAGNVPAANEPVAASEGWQNVAASTSGSTDGEGWQNVAASTSGSADGEGWKDAGASSAASTASGSWQDVAASASGSADGEGWKDAGASSSASAASGNWQDVAASSAPTASATGWDDVKPFTGDATSKAVVSGVAMLMAVPAVLMLAL